MQFKLKKLTVMLAVLLVMIGMSGVTFAQDETENILEKKEYSEKYLEWISLPEEEREGTLPPVKYVNEITISQNSFLKPFQRLLFGMQSQYDLRDYITLKVKNQETTNFCWSFSATTMLESYMGVAQNKVVEYSPSHMEYSTSKTFSDGTNPLAYNRELNAGGSIILAYGYMTSGRGPVLEESMPFNSSLEKISLSEIEGKTVEAKLDEYVIFPSIYKQKEGNVTVCTNGQTGENLKIYTDAEIEIFRNQVKDHIVKYGGVTAQVNATNTKFYNNTSDVYSSVCYYCDDSSVLPDHQIVIVGWDDNYAVTNFNEEHRPSKPGAYLVQNSFGKQITAPDGTLKEVFDDGYIYISYEDVIVETAMTGVTKMSAVNYDNIYQHDPLGCNNYMSTNANEITGANVFTKSDKQEWLNEVSFYTVQGCTYEVYVNSQDGTLNQEKLKKVATVPKKDDAFYTTITLEKPVLLTGNQFAVAVRYISENEAVLPIECISGYNENDVFRTATSNKGESFLCAESSLGNWVDINDVGVFGIEEANACIKAFTTEAKETIILLSSEKYNISEEKKITKISPNTTVAEMLQNISTNATIEVYDKAGNKLSEADIVGTDATMKIVENNEEYKLVVTGDVNGDGKVTGTDLLKLKKHIVKIELFKAPYSDAADVNFSSTITSTDLLKMKQAIVGIINF